MLEGDHPFPGIGEGVIMAAEHDPVLDRGGPVVTGREHVVGLAPRQRSRTSGCGTATVSDSEGFTQVSLEEPSFRAHVQDLALAAEDDGDQVCFTE